MRSFFVAFVLTVPLVIYLAPVVASWIYVVIAFLTPLWLPILLVAIAWPLWTRFTRSQYVFSVPYTIIELKPGTETPRAARAMELVFYSLYHRTEISSYAAIVLGQVRLPWSFELHAHAGHLRFFLYVPTAHRAAIEARLRAEYRDLDIDEATDYSREYHFDASRSKLMMREFELMKPDPYPLKTYAEHEAQKDRADVFNDFLEDIISVGETEHLFVSFLIRPHQRERKNIFGKPMDTLHEDAHREIAALLGPRGDLQGASSTVRETVAAIEAALKKPSFDCGIRALYMADRKHYKREREMSLLGMFDRFSDPERNGFRSYDPLTQVGWPFVDILAAVPAISMDYVLNLYRRRVFFSPPYYGRSFVLNAEELATIYHVPHIGRVSSLSKMRGSRLDPPENLPV